MTLHRLVWLVLVVLGVVAVPMLRRWQRTSHTQVHRITATRP